MIWNFAQNKHGFNGYKLTPGDILKVGRLVFGIWAIHSGVGEEITPDHE